MRKATAVPRFFKTSWFSKAASKAHIGDAELCATIRQAMIGRADDLGGGVFKKRLNNNRYRANIEDSELAAFKKLARAYGCQSEAGIALEIKNGDLLEICHDDQSQI